MVWTQINSRQTELLVLIMSCIAQTTRPIRFENSSATWYDRQVSDSSVWTWCLKAATYSISSYLLLICSSWDNLMITLFNNNQFIRILLRNFFFKKKKKHKKFVSITNHVFSIREMSSHPPPPYDLKSSFENSFFVCVCITADSPWLTVDNIKKNKSLPSCFCTQLNNLAFVLI